MTGAPHRESAPRLEEHPFLRGLAPEFLAALEAGTTRRRFDTGEAIVREGAPAHAFFLLVEGKVAIEVVAPDRPHLIIETVGPGEALGWSWILPTGRWHFDARALKPTHVLVVDAATLRAACEARPADGYRLLERLVPVIAERLENTRLRLLDLHGV